MVTKSATASNSTHDSGPAEPVARAAYFDDTRQVWMLSSYAEVSAALLEPRLWPVSSESTGTPTIDEQQSQTRVRRETLAALPNARLVEWMSNASQLARNIAEALPVSHLVDIVGEFARPWSLALAVQVTGADSAKAQSLAALAEQVSKSTADPQNSSLKESAAAAEKELSIELSDSLQPMAGPAFVALSQTLPALLANAWHILLNHKSEFERLHENRTLLPRAVEELLRLGGLARILHRRALDDVIIRDVHISRGQRVDLLVNVANHDPEQFEEPYRFDLSRPLSGQFALGAGGHACAAAALIRMAMEASTSMLVDYFVPSNEHHEVEWLGGSGFRWPAQVLAQRRT